MDTRDDAGRRQFLSFSVPGTDYAVPILQVREIIQCDAITPVPQVPRWIRGVINLRGSVVPVMDLAAKLGLPPSELGRRSCILVVEARLAGERAVAGVMADAVSEVIEPGPAGVLQPPAFGTRVRVDFLLGMAELGGRFALLLDLDRVLAADAAELAAAVADPVAAGSAAAPPPRAAAAP
jgi:purine-binding chemotaxis protein CheW